MGSDLRQTQTPGERIAETVYYLDDGETYASVEGKRAALAKKIDEAIAKAVKKAKGGEKHGPTVG